jgi:hypothetical protein
MPVPQRFPSPHVNPGRSLVAAGIALGAMVHPDVPGSVDPRGPSIGADTPGWTIPAQVLGSNQKKMIP